MVIYDMTPTHLLGFDGALCGESKLSPTTYHIPAPDYHELRQGVTPERLRVPGRVVDEWLFRPICGWCTLVYSAHNVGLL